MRYYLNNIFPVIIIIGLVITSLVITSCKTTTELPSGISKALYYKSFGGQGRSRSLNFEVYLSKDLGNEQSEFWINYKTFKTKLSKRNKDGITVLTGSYVEHKKSRDSSWNKENSLFNELPIENAHLIIESNHTSKKLLVKKFTTKEAVYHP